MAAGKPAPPISRAAAGLIGYGAPGASDQEGFTRREGTEGGEVESGEVTTAEARSVRPKAPAAAALAAPATAAMRSLGSCDLRVTGTVLSVMCHRCEGAYGV